MSGGGAQPGKGEQPTGTSGESHRLLVLAAAAVEGESLRDEVVRHLAGRSAQLHLIAPALSDSAFAHAMGDVDEPRQLAQERLDRSLETLREDRVRVSGDVGDADPLLAIDDGIGIFSPDEILVITHPDEQARWLEDDIFERARRQFQLPITHVTVDSEGEGIAEVESSESGTDPSPDTEVEGESRNTPVFSARDLAGIAVAIAGTIALVVIVAACPGGPGFETLGHCAVATLIAGLMALLNIAHVVALTLFESTGYRGGWQRMFADVSLIGTPLAVVATVLIVALF